MKHKIGVEVNKKRSKNPPNIIYCNLKKDDQIIIAFGKSIPDTTGHRVTFQVPTYLFMKLFLNCFLDNNSLNNYPVDLSSVDRSTD